MKYISNICIINVFIQLLEPFCGRHLMNI